MYPDDRALPRWRIGWATDSSFGKVLHSTVHDALGGAGDFDVGIERQHFGLCTLIFGSHDGGQLSNVFLIDKPIKYDVKLFNVK